MKRSGKIFGVLAGVMLSMSVWADGVVVIVNKANPDTVDKDFVVKVYTGEVRYWPGGGGVFAIDQAEDSSVRENFYVRMLERSASNMKALWAQNIFTGRGLPPKVADSDDDVKKMVSGNKRAIGYINASSVDDTVKAVVK